MNCLRMFCKIASDLSGLGSVQCPELMDTGMANSITATALWHSMPKNVLTEKEILTRPRHLELQLSHLIVVQNLGLSCIVSVDIVLTASQ